MPSYGSDVYGAGVYPGLLAPAGLVIDGQPIPLGSVLADVTVRHGRADVFDSPSPSTFQATLIGVTEAQSRSFRVGAPLVFTCSDGTGTQPRFTGRVTDGSLDNDVLTVIAVGRLATLSQYTVGAADMPAETWTARLTRAFTEAGLASYLQLSGAPTGNPQLALRPAGATGLDQYLGELVEMVGAAVCDTPDGKIMVQPISTRTLASAVSVDPAEVAFVPAWVQVLPGANTVTVEYATGQVTVTDSASAALYGPRPQTIKTTFVNASDASARASERIARLAYSHWNMPSAPVLTGHSYQIGAPLQLSGFPAGSPYEEWSPILEGWTDSITSDLAGPLDWTMELSLSDPQASGLLLPWNTVPTTAGYHWNTVKPVAWRDALTLGDL